ncbi:MAG: hypothetical protein LUI06_09145 [Ruminococcus sp.]|nr:hypothetical protein [Ruminococcus sp.]
MIINTDNPIIKYSDKGKPFPYDKLFFATIEPYILEFKNARLEKLTEDDAARCLARIYKRMEVNGVSVLSFFKEDLDKWINLDQYHRTMNLANLIARDIFCCYDKNRYDENGEFDVCDRIYCIVSKTGEKDYIYGEEYVKGVHLGKKHLTPESEYFKQLMEFNVQGKLPKEKD